MKMRLVLACALFGTALQVGAQTPSEPLRPGQFQSPLMQLRRLQGAVDHLHVDEIRYIAREYDPAGITAAIEAALAKSHRAESARESVP